MIIKIISGKCREVMNEIKRLFDISMERYNFVVDLLNKDQRKILHQWNVDTGVIQEEE